MKTVLPALLFPVKRWAGVVLIAGVAFVVGSQRAPSAESATVSEDTTAWLVRFGIKDTAPVVWDGTVTAARGEVVRLSSWRPMPKEVIDGTRGWKFSSLWSDAFQNRSWEHEPIVPYGRELRKPGLLVETRGDQPSLTFDTAQGKFTISGPGAALNGRVMIERVAAPVSMAARTNG
jgi:hypothetical protein